MSGPVAPCLLLLGEPAWRDASGQSPWPAERRLQLLAWLAHHGDWVGRDRLATLLWPGHERSAAQRNLRKQLFHLREQPGLPPVEARGRMLRWAVQTDVQLFEAALLAGDDAKALDLWRGPPWHHMAVDGAEGEGGLSEWLTAERARLQHLWRGAMLRQAQAHPTQASQLAQPLLQANPLDEDALQVLMQGHLLGGRPAEAAAAYASFARNLQDELQLQPGARTLALLRQANESKPPEAGEQSAHADFIGRAAEQRDLQTLLGQRSCRWLTVLGAGGCGKTRLVRTQFMAGLAQHAALRLWVDLDDLNDTTQALRRVASSCGADPADHIDILALICKALGQRSVLLVLDNMEQLPQAAQLLASALSACPGVQVVATSRVRLGVAGEHLLSLGGLPWPLPEDSAQALAFDAVKLFLLHARRHAPVNTISAQLPAVVALCAWVEGNPLALLLAAPWTRHLKVAAILQELERGRAEMLSHGADAAPSRQHSMEACFEQSWRLLSPVEREALVRLTVFTGSFTMEAALLVTAAPLAVLASLLDKSLLQSSSARAVEPAPRFSLHPLWALYARQRGHPATLALARAAHASHHLGRLARLPPPTQAAARDAFLTATQQDAENIAAAWFYAVQRGNRSAIEAAASGWTLHCYVSGQASQGMRGLRAAKALFEDGSLGLAQLCFRESWLHVNLGDLPQAMALAQQALARLRRGDDPEALLRCRQVLAGVMSRRGHLAASLRLHATLLRHFIAEGRDMQSASTLYEMAYIEFLAGRLTAALARNTQAMELLKKPGLSSDLIVLFQARLQLCCGDPSAALQTLQPLLLRPPDVVSTNQLSDQYMTLAEVSLALGNTSKALDAASRARELDTHGDLPEWSARLALRTARLELAMGQPQEALARLHRAAKLLAGRDWTMLDHQLAVATAQWLLSQGPSDQALQILAALLGQPVREAMTHQLARRLLGRRKASRDITHESLLLMVTSALAQTAQHAQLPA